MLRLLFPSKCSLCNTLLAAGEEHLCSQCLSSTESFAGSKRKISFVAGWTALWYYKDNVRACILNYKFHNQRHHSTAFGHLLAQKLQDSSFGQFDFITWVPLSSIRLRQRGFDHVKKIAVPLSRALGTPLVRTLVKTVHNPPQSTMKGYAERKANTLGVYRLFRPNRIAGKRVLLVDDILTTGATASECAKMLLLAGAAEVYFAAVAARQDYNPTGESYEEDSIIFK